MWDNLFNFYYEKDLDKLKEKVNISTDIGDYIYTEMLIEFEGDVFLPAKIDFLQKSLTNYVINNHEKLDKFSDGNQVNFIFALSLNLVKTHSIWLSENENKKFIN